MPPFMGGGDMISSVTFEKSTWNVLPYKFEAGTPDIAGAVGLHAALDYIDAIGLDAIAAHERELLAYGTEVLEAVAGRPPHRHRAGEGQHPVVRDGGRAPARHRHHRGSRRRRDPHRASLRAAGDGALRRAGDRARVARDVQHARGDRRARARAGTRCARCSR